MEELFLEYIQSAGVPKLCQLIDGRLSHESVEQDLMKIETSGFHGDLDYYDRSLEFVLDLTDAPIAIEDTDLGPPLMSECDSRRRSGKPMIDLYDHGSCHFDGEWESSFDLERIEMMSKGRCWGCVDWKGDADRGVPGWPEKMRREQEEW